ncbi:hypothetical protein HX99_05905 [Peptococcaceae bacterium SCADC1_2_3]|jgi:hypothetical protein|nr:hypothetical protein DK28_0208470 [Peptococcaceae bacterium SCADC1_2_3]KFI35544.1 hypothetical protein HY00_03775 [Peptococcaceae bacterium SCADC1_2_3]KFI36935.1 hypothetical protein HX99_05905 [Peptococcaceae bacterium SCADC1_2_3]
MVLKNNGLPETTKSELLSKLMLAWDGQWFLKVVEEFGLEYGLKLNTRVRLAFARIEMRSLLEALNKKRADNFEEAIRIIIYYCREVLNISSQHEIEIVNHSTTIKVTFCPILENCRRANLPRYDQACLGCPQLWQEWLKTLLPEEKCYVQAVKQMGRNDEFCLLYFF